MDTKANLKKEIPKDNDKQSDKDCKVERDSDKQSSPKDGRVNVSGEFANVVKNTSDTSSKANTDKSERL
ncbi:MAG: hypothetical protein IPL83_01685 [Bdellovibrionales bacterium]|nr:hypothetical protein [Bdellovibrionales bacterium]